MIETIERRPTINQLISKQGPKVDLSWLDEEGEAEPKPLINKLSFQPEALAAVLNGENIWSKRNLASTRGKYAESQKYPISAEARDLTVRMAQDIALAEIAKCNPMDGDHGIQQKSVFSNSGIASGQSRVGNISVFGQHAEDDGHGHKCKEHGRSNCTECKVAV